MLTGTASLSGCNQEETCARYPFGYGLSFSGAADPTEHHFTGKERDTDSGLDYFGARYLSSDLGRFLTPDWAAKPVSVPYARFGNPQSLNLYGYTLNNPVLTLDPDGHDPGYAGGNENYGAASAGGFASDTSGAGEYVPFGSGASYITPEAADAYNQAHQQKSFFSLPVVHAQEEESPEEALEEAIRAPTIDAAEPVAAAYGPTIPVLCRQMLLLPLWGDSIRQ